MKVKIRDIAQVIEFLQQLPEGTSLVGFEIEISPRQDFSSLRISPVSELVEVTSPSRVTINLDLVDVSRFERFATQRLL